MKNHLLRTLPLFIILFFFFSPNQNANAQSEIGIKGGALYSGIKYNNYITNLNVDNFSGFEFGIYYNKKNILGPIGLQSEILYQLKGVNTYSITSSFRSSGDGYQYNYDGFGGYEYSPYGNEYGGYGPSPNYPLDEESDGNIYLFNTRVTQKYHTFAIPLLLEFSPFKIFDIYAGPQLNLILNKKNTLPFANYKNVTAGLTFGGKLKLGESTKLNFRYTTDLTPTYTLYGADQKGQNFSVGIQQTIFRKPNK